MDRIRGVQIRDRAGDAHDPMIRPRAEPQPLRRGVEQLPGRRRQSAVREQMAAIGNEPMPSTPEAYAKYINEQVEKMKEIVRLGGIKPQD